MIRPRGRRGALGALLLVVLFFVGGTSAETSESTWAYDLAGDLMSPYCPGRTLASCPSPQAAELVQWIALQESAGATREEVVEILVERFGEEILGAPPARGITLWAYVFPVVGFVVGGAIAFLVLRRIVAKPGLPGAAGSPFDAPAAGAAPTPEEDDLARLVDEDLAARS